LLKARSRADVLEVRIKTDKLAIPYAYNAFSPGAGFCGGFSLREDAHHSARRETNGRGTLLMD